jgi:hypothetical protein
MFTPAQYYDSCMWPGDRPIYPGEGSGAAFGGPADDLTRTASVHIGDNVGRTDDAERTASVHFSHDDMDDDAAH